MIPTRRAPPTGGRLFKHLLGAVKVVAGSSLSATTRELVAIRASQVNGCGFCVDMHTKDAAALGEDPSRLNVIAAWREATIFTEAERAALELAEQGTRLADAAGGVTDEAWAEAAQHYDEEQLTALVAAIAVTNAFNRLNVMVKEPAGTYQPGQFGWPRRGRPSKENECDDRCSWPCARWGCPGCSYGWVGGPRTSPLDRAPRSWAR